MKAIAVAAGAIHGLALSVAYGGPVFAKVGLKRAVRKIASKEERRAVMQTAWSRFSKVNVPAHVGFTASWLVLRSMLNRVYLDRSTKHLLVAKDVLIAGALLTGVAATINGKAMKRALPSTTAPSKANEGEKTATNKGEADKGNTKGEKAASKETTAKDKEYNRLLRLERKLGRANMAFIAGAIIISPAIGLGIFRSQRMGFIQRLINR
jgi:hypothetical protein